MGRWLALMIATPLALELSCVVPIDDVVTATGGAPAGGGGAPVGGGTSGMGGMGGDTGGTAPTGGAGGAPAGGGTGGSSADAAPDSSGGTGGLPCNGSCQQCIELGRVATWCGKVNVHKVDNIWVTDSDCSSGCNLDKLEYCKKFYPKTQIVQDTPPVGEKVFKQASCVGEHPFIGEAEYICLGC